MFWVLNKDKVYSYIVTLSVISVLFGLANFIPKNETVHTTSNKVEIVDIEKKNNEKVN